MNENSYCTVCRNRVCEQTVLTGFFDPAPGLKYRSYEGRFRSALKIDQGRDPADRGVQKGIGVARKNGESEAGLVLEGFIEVPCDGVFTLHVASDNCSMLWIGEDPVVENDGFHDGIDPNGNPKTKSGQVSLKKDLHPLKINYFDWRGSELLKVFIEEPGIEYQEVSQGTLFN